MSDPTKATAPPATVPGIPAEWHGTRRDYPRTATVHRLFEDQAARTPDARALLFADQVISYRALNEAANRIAHRLLRHGIGRGALVGLCLRRSPELIAATLGILKAGAAYVPLDVDYPDERLAFMLRDTAAPAILCHKATLSRLAVIPHGTHVLCVDDETQTSTPGIELTNPATEVTADDPAYVMYTSGSTGTPKGVVVGHRPIIRLVRETNYCDFSPAHVFLQFAPVSFDAATFEIWGALLNGACLAIMSPDPPGLDELGAAIRQFGVTTLWLTAGLFHVMVDQRPEHLRPLKQLLAGGDILSPVHVAKALAALDDGVVINGYGPTESTTFAVCHRMAKGDSVGATIPIGRPLTNTTVSILDEHLRPSPRGAEGELCIGGDGLALRYLNQPALTAEKFVPDPINQEPGARIYRTGDRARFCEDGTIEFLGRVDNQVKISGHRIELGEIEAALRRHPGVADAVVIATSFTAAEKSLVAYIVGHPEAPCDTAAIRKHLAEQLPQFMVPSLVMAINRLPLTANGKVDRAALPPPEREFITENAHAAPVTELEKAITLIWGGVLCRSVGINDNFFDVGGNSLRLIEVHSQLQKILSFELSLMDMFEHPTIRTLAAHLAADGPSASSLSAIQSRAKKQQAMLLRQKHMRPGR